MKENSLDSHRGKVAENKAIAAVAIRSESTTSTNFDDDYNEWELGIGDLIIDLDADIEKNNEKQQLATSSSVASATLSSPTSTSPSNIGLTVLNTNNCSSPASPNGNCAENTVANNNTNSNNNPNHHYHHHHHQAALQQANFVVMSSGKNKLNNNNNTNGSGGGGGGPGGGGNGGGNGGSGSGNGGSGGNSNGNLGASNVEHQATVDKGLKMKIKRTKPTKTSEAKHEIVKSDTKPSSPVEAMNVGNGNGNGGGAGGNGSGAGSAAGSGGMGNNGNSGNNSGSGGLLGGSSVQTGISGGLSGSESGNVAGSGAGGGGGKSKHASSKGRGGSHREKKERARDKDRGEKERGNGGKSIPASANVTNVDVNGAHANSGNGGGSTACSINTSAIKLSNSTINVASLPTPTVNLGIPANVNQMGLSGGSANAGGGGGGGGIANAANNGSNLNGNASACGNGASASATISSSSSASNFSNGCGAVGAGAGQGTTSNCGAVNGSGAGAASNTCGVANAGGAGPNGSSSCNSGNGANSANGTNGGTSNAASATAGVSSLSVKLEPKYPNVPISTFATIKLEDNQRGVPNKRMRLTMEKSPDKNSQQSDQCMSPKAPEMHDICVGTSVGTITEPECLGPCEPGTTVTLEGIVWQETEGGVLVVNVTWRGKTYVGTLLDCTKHDWAPPRFCESPTSDVESRTPKGRGKRGRGGAAAAANVDPTNFTETRSAKLRNANKGRRTNNSGFTAPPSPAKLNEGLPLVGMKRKGRPVELELSQAADVKSNKRSRSQSRGTPTNSTPPADQPSSPVLIECPEPNCSKKYKHINGLRYHQTHAHHSNNSHPSGTNEDSPDEPLKDASSENDESTQESVPQSPGGVGSSSSSDRNQRSSPRPFTGKVPQPPSCNTSDFKPAVPIASIPNSNNSSNSSTSSSPSPSLPVTEVNGDPANTSTFPNCTTDLTSVDTKANVAPVVGSSSVNKSGVETLCVNVPSSTNSNDASNMLWYGQSNSASPIGSQSQADNTNGKVASPSFSSSMSVITSTSATRVTSPVAAAAAPLSLSPSPHQSPRHLASVTIQQQQQQQQLQQHQQPLGLAAQIYHHHQFAHPSAGTVGAENPTVPIGIALPSSVVGGSIRPPSASLAGLASHPLSPSIAGTAGGPPSPHNLSDKSSRPITPPSATIPSPSSLKQSQMLSASPPPNMNLNALQPMSSKSVMSSTMKPLQSTKPGAEPVLDGIKRERSKHRKRSRDREREQRKSGCGSSSGPPYNMHLHGLDLASGHHSAVDADKMNGVIYSKVNDLIGKDRLPGSSPDMPLDLNTSSADNASTCNDNVQSPAYSDISDANDSTPAPENDAPTIKDNKEDKSKMSPEQNNTPAHNLSPYGGVYSYYSQPSYVVPPLSTQSPPTPRNSATVSGERAIKEEVITLDKPEEKHTKDSGKHWSERSRSSSGNHDRGMPGSEPQDRMMHASNQMIPMAAHMQAAHEFQMHQQKQLLQHQQQQQQQFATNAFAYSHGYGFHYMDQTYPMHMKQDPYKHPQQYSMEEKERLYANMGFPKDVHHERLKDMSVNNKEKGQNLSKDSGNKNSNENMGENSRMSGRRSSELGKQVNASSSSASSSHNISNSGKDRDSHTHHSQRSSHQSSHHMDRMMSVGGAMPPGSRVEALSASLKEKQHDNHGNMKDNMDSMKCQMDKKASYEQMLYHHHNSRQDYVRYMLYHDQKNVEEMSKKEEMAAAAAASGNKHHYENKTPISSKEQPSSKNISSVSHPSTSSHSSSSSSSSSRGSSSSPKVSLGIGGSKDNASGKDSAGSKKDGDREKGSVGDSSLSSESGIKEKKESDQRAKSQEGQKPTMETQGPPPPTNSYAYMHPAYMQSPHYSPIAFDPSMYRSMNPMIMTAGHYPGAPYLHPQLPVRYHVPQQAVEPQQDLSPKMHHQTKALDLLQHHASQYYSSHKIHELQDHAIKPPGPGAGNGPVVGSGVQTSHMNPSKMESSAKPDSMVNAMNSHDRSTRSPPLQRHLHTHHHTHVGVGYPIYDPYGGKPIIRH